MDTLVRAFRYPESLYYERYSIMIIDYYKSNSVTVVMLVENDKLSDESKVVSTTFEHPNLAGRYRSQLAQCLIGHVTKKYNGDLESTVRDVVETIASERRCSGVRIQVVNFNKRFTLQEVNRLYHKDMRSNEDLVRFELVC